MGRSIVIGASIAFAVVCAGCIATPGATREPYTQTIAVDAQGCPSAVTSDPRQPDCPKDRGKKCVTKEDKVKWVAAKGAREFEIHFDPFRGRTVKATCHGNGCETPPLPIDGGAPPSEPEQGEVEYKYTVAANGCVPLDPPIFIQR